METLSKIQVIQGILKVSQDGSWGDASQAALKAVTHSDSQDHSQVVAIQNAVGAKPDGAWGPLSQGALDAIVHPELAESDPETHLVKATSFADPADVAAFRRCKAKGLSDQECFLVGDNGVGKWGDDCTTSTPMFALPPEDWEQFGKSARLKKAIISRGNVSVTALLGDTMPHRRNITNGAGIDMSPALVKALGLQPPVDTHVTWRWV